MKKVAFDTNVILDAAMGRDGSEKAQELIQAVVDGKLTGLVTADTITDIHYIVRKRAGEKAARAVVYNVLALFDVACADGEACAAALNADMNDYEDAVLAVCAAREGADCIATNDEEFAQTATSPVRAMHPDKILEAIR